MFEALRSSPEKRATRASCLAMRFLKHRTVAGYDTQQPLKLGQHPDHFEPDEERLERELLGEIEREEGCPLRNISEEKAGLYTYKLYEVSSERVRREIEAMRQDGTIAKYDAILESLRNTPLHPVPKPKRLKPSRRPS